MVALREEVLERSREVCAKLREGDVITNAYKHGPLSDSICTVGTHMDVVRVWSGLADIDVRPDRTKRQAVMNIVEGDRQIEKVYGIMPKKGADGRISQDTIHFVGQRAFPVGVPEGAEFSFEVLDYHYIMKQWRSTGEGLKIRGTMKMPNTKLSLLVGMDEVAQFISALPENHVDSVAEAHDLLRGNVPTHARRQGEWFFVPVDHHESIAIDRYLRRGEAAFRAAQLEPGSNHHASVLITVNRKRYAVGVVADLRGDRHYPLVLPTWHRVERNRELAVPASMSQRPVRWD